METFNFPYHRVGDDYPESGVSMKFGGGYQFASAPTGPDQMNFKLNFTAMWFFTKANGTLDPDVEPLRNMRQLELFYEKHRLYQKFNYSHPRRGLVVCRFAKPLSTPDGIEDGKGQVQAFTVELISQP